MTDNRTTELREKLTERGVKYEVTFFETFTDTEWCVNDASCTYTEIQNVDSAYLTIQDITPDQAIAATLGYEVNPDGLPVGLTISEDGNLLNWRGENYVRQDATLGADDNSRWFELFGTPERAAKTLAAFCDKCKRDYCNGCKFGAFVEFNMFEEDMLEWLRGKAKLLRGHADGLKAPYVIPSTKEPMMLTILDSATRMEEAADTILSLRDRLQDAELGSGTCEVEVRESAWGGYTRHCGNCSADLDCDTRNRQNFCPNCGKAVKR